MAEELRRAAWPRPSERWWRRAAALDRAFAILNIGFLTFDIYLAHSVNQFRSQAEYIPAVFLGDRRRWCCCVALAAAHALAARSGTILGYLVGWAAIAGRARRRDSAPREPVLLRAHAAQPDLLRALCRAAGLHRPGISADHESHGGSAESAEWAQWVLLLTLGGFIGNFVFSLTDHAENGFFIPAGVGAGGGSAFAVGFLAVPLLTRVSPRIY